MKRVILVINFIVFTTLILGACSSPESGSTPQAEDTIPVQDTKPRMGMGPGSGMMNRHHAQVPDAYAGLTNLIPPDDESLARGEEIYATQCATCHGDYGNGDGPGGEVLDPAPAPLAHTAQMMGDAYLFWRITEGGIPFETGMIAYRDILDEQARWDVINYIRALGTGQVQPGRHMGGKPFDQAGEQAQRVEMLSNAVEQGVITQAEADLFDQVHTLMDEYLVTEGASGMNTGPRADALPQILSSMFKDGLVTEHQSNSFLETHDLLIESGLMQ